jgi:hypothetical protein
MNEDKKFLNRYFRSIYNKLEADALLFNRKLPHAGIAGAANESALAEVIRNFLPPRFGVEPNALVIDRHGAVSRECDIVVYDREHFPQYFRKVLPVEMTYAVIEVKTEFTRRQAASAHQVHSALRKLDYYPALTPYWETRTADQKIHHSAPIFAIFAYRTRTINFETFCRWLEALKNEPHDEALYQATTWNQFLACSLDKGIVKNVGDGHMQRWMAVANEKDQDRNFACIAFGKRLEVDPAKSLFLFLETLWQMLWQSPRHPGFDIRSYMDTDIGEIIPVPHDDTP